MNSTVDEWWRMAGHKYKINDQAKKQLKKKVNTTLFHTPFLVVMIKDNSMDSQKHVNLVCLLLLPFERVFYFCCTSGSVLSVSRWGQCVSIGGHCVSTLRYDEIN